MIAVTTNCSTL